ncbi:MAG: helix-turn-helix domain-containing protein, partial [Candidatus Brocadiales bacterium]|nr:helix-turn-helix domain-containing protein [Candidatus Bathyanammoxibius sp.]
GMSMCPQTRTTSRDDKDEYLELVQQFSLRPIRSDRELDDFQAMLDNLLDRESLSAQQQDYFNTLESRISDYEREHHKIRPVSDAELLRHLIDAKGVSQVDVTRSTGIVESTISAVLAGTRRLTREHIEKLARYFSVSVETFSFQSK